MSLKNSKTSNTHRLLLNLTEKVNLKRTDRYFALSNIYTLHRKYKKVI